MALSSLYNERDNLYNEAVFVQAIFKINATYNTGDKLKFLDRTQT